MSDTEPDEPPRLYPTQDSDDVSPRVLVQFTLYERDNETVEQVAYEAQDFTGCLTDGRGYDMAVIGFAEFPRNSTIGRISDAETFVATVESKAEYVHWKPDGDEIDVLGAPPMVDDEDGDPR